MIIRSEGSMLAQRCDLLTSQCSRHQIPATFCQARLGRHHDLHAQSYHWTNEPYGIMWHYMTLLGPEQHFSNQ